MICRCGNTGCLEALAGGAALARDAVTAADDPRSTYLGQAKQAGRDLTSGLIIESALHGDPVATEMLSSSALFVGEALASMVNLFNPSLIVIGGSVGRSLDMYLATIRKTVLNRSLPLATRSLQIVTSPLGDQAGLIGAAYTVIDELLSRAAGSLARARQPHRAQPADRLAECFESETPRTVATRCRHVLGKSWPILRPW